MAPLPIHARALKIAVPGINVEVNGRTDNLIVHDGRRGFVVTHVCLESWPTVLVNLRVGSAWREMIAGLDRSGGVLFRDLSELRGQALNPTTFSDDDVPACVA